MTFRDPALLPPGVPRLKPRTRYRCPADQGGLGHSASWTGDLSTGQGPHDHLCVCGEELVEVVEDGHTYRISWESVGPFSQEWHPSSRTSTDFHSILQQYRQLTEWERTGAEAVRTVKIERAVTIWESYEP